MSLWESQSWFLGRYVLFGYLDPSGGLHRSESFRPSLGRQPSLPTEVTSGFEEVSAPIRYTYIHTYIYIYGISCLDTALQPQLSMTPPSWTNFLGASFEAVGKIKDLGVMIVK